MLIHVAWYRLIMLFYVGRFASRCNPNSWFLSRGHVFILGESETFFLDFFLFVCFSCFLLFIKAMDLSLLCVTFSMWRLFNSFPDLLFVQSFLFLDSIYSISFFGIFSICSCLQLGHLGFTFICNPICATLKSMQCFQ